MGKLFKKVYDNKNLFIFVCVCLLTVITIGISYSAFFAVKTNTSNQTVKTGTLSVTYSGSTPALSNNDIQPLTDTEGMQQSENRVVYIQNTGTLDSKYVLNIGYDMESFNARNNPQSTDKLTPIEYIRFAIYNYNSSNNTSTLIAGPLSISDLPIYNYNTDSRYNRYSLLIGSIGSATSNNATKTYQIKIWLSDEASTVASKTFFYVNTEVEATAKGDTMAYNISGTLRDASSNAISGAKISLHNNSITTTTSNGGTFTLNAVPVGTYNIDITVGTTVYKGNLTIEENGTASITSYGTGYATSGNVSVFELANDKKISLSNFMKLNNITDITTDVVLNGDYNLPASYNIKGEADKTIELNVSLTNDGKIGNITLQ